MNNILNISSKKKSLIFTSLLTGVVAAGTMLGAVSCGGKTISKDEFIEEYAKRTLLKDDTTSSPYSKVHAKGEISQDGVKTSIDGDYNLSFSSSSQYGKYISVNVANFYYINVAYDKTSLSSMLGQVTSDTITVSYKSEGDNLIYGQSGTTTVSGETYSVSGEQKFDKNGFLIYESATMTMASKTSKMELTFSNYKA